MPNLDKRKIKYKILKVDPAAHSLSIPEDFVYDKDIIKINGNTGVNVQFASDQDRLIVTIDVTMSGTYLDEINDPLNLFTLKAVTTFKIDDMANHIKDLEDFDINDEELIHFIEISLDHARGMQATYLKGSTIARFIMPKIDLSTAKPAE